MYGQNDLVMDVINVVHAFVKLYEKEQLITLGRHIRCATNAHEGEFPALRKRMGQLNKAIMDRMIPGFTEWMHRKSAIDSRFRRRELTDSRLTKRERDYLHDAKCWIKYTILALLCCSEKDVSVRMIEFFLAPFVACDPPGSVDRAHFMAMVQNLKSHLVNYKSVPLDGEEVQT